MSEKSEKEPSQAFVFSALFVDQTDVLHGQMKVGTVRSIMKKEYWIQRGHCPARHQGQGHSPYWNIHKHTRPEDVPKHILLVITSDSMENASRQYSAQRMKEMIRQQKEKYGCGLFLGANINVLETADHLGIAPDRAVNCHYESSGTHLNYEVLN